MRIGVDCRSLQEEEPSGVSVYTLELLRSLVALPESQQHTIVCFLNGGKLGERPEWLERLQQEIQGPHIEWRIRTLSNKLMKFTEIAFSQPSARWMFGDVDVVFVPSIQFYPVWSRKGPPVVLTVHDLSFERYPDCLSVKRRMWHRLLYPRQAVRMAKRVVTVSENTANDLQELYGTPDSKIVPIHPGMEPKRPDPGVAMSSDGSSDSVDQMDLPDRFVLSLSTLEPRKNINALLQAFEMIQDDHPGVELLVAGGRGWKSEQTRRWLDGSDRMRYFGYVSIEEKAELLRRADVFVYPSLYEGFGFPPLEAQMHRTPVVVGSHSSLPEVLQNSALYADIHDARSLARAMDHLLSDSDLRVQYSERGTENVKRFSWSSAARSVLRVLEEVNQEQKNK